jgi:3-phenylpropionate/trans-cinnamate dioxygenase ferredoxin subunit
MAEFVTVARTSDIPAGEVRVYNINGKELAVAHTDEGFFAIDDVCTHDGGPLGEGYVEDCQIECPRHGARFDLKTGKAVTLPAVIGVTAYPTRVEGDEVQVEVR